MDGHGRIVIAWIDKRDVIAATAQGKPYLGAAVYYSWSDDDGASFVPERKLVDQSCECCRIALARMPDGGIAALFRNIYGDNIRDHAYGVLRTDGTDGQTSHVERATFSDWQIAGCPHHGPGLAIGNDDVRHAVWYEAKGKPTIWYGQLDPGQAPQHPLVIATTGASHADVAVHERTVWVVWNQVSANGYALMLRRSTDNGAHFDAPRGDSPQQWRGCFAAVAAEARAAFVAWNTAAGFRLLGIQR